MDVGLGRIGVAVPMVLEDAAVEEAGDEVSEADEEPCEVVSFCVGAGADVESRVDAVWADGSVVDGQIEH